MYLSASLRYTTPHHHYYYHMSITIPIPAGIYCTPCLSQSLWWCWSRSIMTLFWLLLCMSFTQLLQPHLFIIIILRKLKIMSDVTADSSNSSSCVVWETTNNSTSPVHSPCHLASWTTLHPAYKQQLLEECVRLHSFLPLHQLSERWSLKW